MKAQLENQLLTGVFENIKFNRLYNQCRYPSYQKRRQNYFILEISPDDCKHISIIAKKLDKFLADFYKLSL